MVKKLEIHRYKKLANIVVDFSPGVNAISGTNGTCKTTFLHIASNAFQAMKANDERILDPSALRRINQLNAQVNTKMEKLAKGDREYNDPAPNFDGGNLFEVSYFDNTKLSFRKHNSKAANRYAIKPYYKKDSGDKLPSMPVVYLSLARLLPWGEYQGEDSSIKSSVKTDQAFYEELSKLYQKATGIHASSFSSQNMGSVKKRQEFDTDAAGVDSNTVSSGEDNVAIILTALLSLKYLFQALDKEAQRQTVCSLLLVDEFDATLHPSLQYTLLEIMRGFAFDYHIQIIFTTHSLTLINTMLKKKLKVIYLKNNGNVVKPMTDPDPLKIEMHLRGITKSDLMADKIIPAFSEDEEARVFVGLITDWLGISRGGFKDFGRNVHFVDAAIGAEQLEKLFKDRMIRQSSMASICVLDGDHNSNLSNNIVALPGGKSPEWIAFDYACELAKDGLNPFWDDQAVESEGYTYELFAKDIEPSIDAFRASEKSERAAVKGFFNKHFVFFRYVLKQWIRDESNSADIKRFADDLAKLYRKTANYHGICLPRDIEL